MHYSGRSLTGSALPLLAIALALGGCSGAFDKLSESTPKMSDFTSIEWNPYTKASSTVAPSFRAASATASDYVNADGSCAGPQTQVADGGDPAPMAPTGGGVALQMTECAVVRALGAPEMVDLGSNERGERTAKLLYSRGERPGKYSFTAGLLTEIERVEPPPEPPKSKKPPPKPAPRRTS